MKSKEFQNVKISGIACALPTNIIYTDSFDKNFGKEKVERFKNATGIDSRYVSIAEQTASDLCFEAASALLKKKHITGEDIDALIFITQSGDYKTPSTAYVLHKRLSIKKDCLVFDINLGCSGFVNGIYILSGLIESGTINRALLLVGDVGKDSEGNDDVSFTMMFGDAGAACLLEKGKGTVRGMIRSDGEGFHTLITPFPGARFPDIKEAERTGIKKKMDGDDVFLFSITKVPALFKEFYKTFHCSIEDFDYVMLHQANLMMINQISKKLKIPSEKVPVSLCRYGNTDGASIPLGIVDLCENEKTKETLRLINAGFGIGLSWGVVSFDVEKEDVLPLIFTDDYYKEGRTILSDDGE